MFRFVYASTAGEPWDDALAAEGFVGVEGDAGPPGVACVGWRGSGSPALGNGYIARPVIAAGSPSAAGVRLHADAEANPGRLIFFENGGAFRTAWDLWTVLEAAHHPRVQLALNIDTARANGQAAAVLIPTLNLRIGLVRVVDLHEDLADYARRLAGIGFEGCVTIDPPAGPDRLSAARAIAAVFRGVIYVKPVKKAVASKPAPKPLAASNVAPIAMADAKD